MPGMGKRSLIVFHRHGHRAPAHNVHKLGQAAEAEAALWRQFLPSAAAFERLSTLHPISSHAGNPTPNDLQSAPFGILTNKGMQHLESTGGGFYRHFKAHDVFRAARATLQVHATNYQRTQASAQCFLVGIGAERGDNILAGSGGEETEGARDKRVPVRVRDIAKCSMAFYEGRPQLAQALLTRAQSTEGFLHMEARGEIKKATADMRLYLPGLTKGWPSDNGFNWMAAFDYFACRQAHNLGSNVFPQLAQYEGLVRKHICARYGRYYSDPFHLAHFILPLLRDVQACVGSGGGGLHIYSCHDVNLLGLLYALRALGSESGSALGPILGANFPNLDAGYWPYYGTTITIDAGDDDLCIYLDQASEPICRLTRLQLGAAAQDMHRLIKESGEGYG